MKPLSNFIRTAKDHELSAQEFESYSNAVLLTAFYRKKTMQEIGINKAKLGLELINRGIHPFIKK